MGKSNDINGVMMNALSNTSKSCTFPGFYADRLREILRALGLMYTVNTVSQWDKLTVHNLPGQVTNVFHYNSCIYEPRPH